ncbi:MAG: ABC transporter permease [Panacagrimonas sp.]
MASSGRAGRRGVIGVVSPVVRQSMESLADFDIVEYDPEALLSSGQKMASELSLLVVGGDYKPLKLALPALRSTVPDLPVVALAESLDRRSQLFYRNHVDGLYRLPGDAQKLARIVSTHRSPALSAGASLWSGSAANGLLATSVLFLIWWLAVGIFNPPEYLLPGPVAVLSTLADQPSAYLTHLAVTGYEALLGFMVGNTFGILIAIALYRYSRFKKYTLPVLISFQAIPVVALAPLLVVWLGTGLASKVAMAGIICFFPMVINALHAFSNMDRDYVELFDFYRAGYWSKIRMLLMPASFSAIVAALKISGGLSVVGAIVAELTGADRGLGYILLNASYRLETASMFVGMLLSAVLGIVFFHMPALLKYVVPRSWSSGLS